MTVCYINVGEPSVYVVAGEGIAAGAYTLRALLHVDLPSAEQGGTRLPPHPAWRFFFRFRSLELRSVERIRVRSASPLGLVYVSERRDREYVVLSITLPRTCVDVLHTYLCALSPVLSSRYFGLDEKVARPRDCTMCRECIREPGWSEKVSLSRIADHFIFGIESVGMLPPKVRRCVTAVLVCLLGLLGDGAGALTRHTFLKPPARL